MSDRELLELAAKAAGIDLYWGGITPPYIDTGDGLVLWDALKSDGDALRLAVKLGIQVWRDDDVIWCNGERFGFDDPYAATRRAIVRAAAEIGRDMK